MRKAVLGPSLRCRRGPSPTSPRLQTWAGRAQGRPLPMTLASAVPVPLQEPLGGSPGSVGSLAAGLGTRGDGVGPTWAVGGILSGRASSRRGLGGLAPVMNLDDIRLPLLLNSLSGLGGGRDSKGSPSEPRDLVSEWPRQQAQRAPALDGRRPSPGPRQGPGPRRPPAGAPTRRMARGLLFRVPCAGWSGDFACFRAHLPADALTLSAPIIIQSVLLRAAIP